MPRCACGALRPKRGATKPIGGAPASGNRRSDVLTLPSAPPPIQERRSQAEVDNAAAPSISPFISELESLQGRREEIVAQVNALSQRGRMVEVVDRRRV